MNFYKHFVKLSITRRAAKQNFQNMLLRPLLFSMALPMESLGLRPSNWITEPRRPIPPRGQARNDVQGSTILEWIINSMSTGIGWVGNQLTVANSKGSWTQILSFGRPIRVRFLVRTRTEPWGTPSLKQIVPSPLVLEGRMKAGMVGLALGLLIKSVKVSRYSWETLYNTAIYFDFFCCLSLGW